MGDRRSFDRRAPEKGVLKISVKSFIIYGILIACIIVLVGINFYFYKKNKEYKNIISQYEEMYFDLDSDNQNILNDADEGYIVN